MADQRFEGRARRAGRGRVAVAVGAALCCLAALAPAAGADEDGTVRAQSGDIRALELADDPACFETSMTPNDDDAFGPVPLGFDIDFFGQQHSTVWVNNNGFLSFGEEPQFSFDPSSTIRNTPFPIIAPFFADVDTRGIGEVSFGSGFLPDGSPFFCATWADVGHFDQRTDKTNSFQVVLIDLTPTTGMAAFGIAFVYDRIEWETGDASGGTNGLGGNSARVGYSSGSGFPSESFELPGSGLPGSFIRRDAPPANPGLVSEGLNSVDRGTYLFLVFDGVPQAPDYPDLVSDGRVTTTYTDIITVGMFDIAGGFADGTFGPALRVRRDQVTKFIVNMLTTNGTPLPPASGNSFNDTAGNVHRQTIEQAAAAGITTGRADGSFDPSGNVTRGQMASFIDRACQLPEAPPGTANFPDTAGNTHEAAIRRVAAAGIVTGTADGRFVPNAPVTRGQTARFIGRAISLSPSGTPGTFVPACRPQG